MPKYYFINRPPSIGTHPVAGLLDKEAWSPSRPIPGGERYAHGWVTYQGPLSFDQIWRYELWPEDADELDRYYDWRDENNK